MHEARGRMPDRDASVVVSFVAIRFPVREHDDLLPATYVLERGAWFRHESLLEAG